MLQRIAYLLVAAQGCSDQGKTTEKHASLGCVKVPTAHEGYAGKDYYIQKALVFICRRPDCGVRFYVCRDDENVAKYIVYFDYRLSNGWKQISFHSFDDDLSRFVDTSKRSKTSWDQKDVRKNVAELASIYGIECQYTPPTAK